MTPKDITDAWAKIRKIDQSIPDDVLDFMKNAAIEKLNSDIKDFTLFWLDGKRELVRGRDAADAMTKAGYGAGAVRALDFHAPGDSYDYKWNEKDRKWDLTEAAKKKLFNQ
jgi:hypothetical protein